MDGWWAVLWEQEWVGSLVEAWAVEWVQKEQRLVDKWALWLALLMARVWDGKWVSARASRRVWEMASQLVERLG